MKFRTTVKIQPLPAEKTGRDIGLLVGSVVATLALTFLDTIVAVALASTVVSAAGQFGRRIGRARHFRRKREGSAVERDLAWWDEHDQANAMELAAAEHGDRTLRKVVDQRWMRIRAQDAGSHLPDGQK